MFNKIDVSMFQEYMTKYPNGKSIFESLSQTLTSFNTYVEEVNVKFGTLPEQMQALLETSQLTADQLNVLEEYFTLKAAALADLETNYAPRLGLVESQLADTMNKTAVTLSHQFVDNTARDTYFTANPLEKINLTFIKVGTAYQQFINSVWVSASPVLAEVVKAINQPFTPVGGISATNTQGAIAELDTEKANKSQEAWTTLTLLNAWVNVGLSYANASFYKDSLGVVHLNGTIKSGTGQLFSLPAGYRPLKVLRFVTVAYNNGVATITINPSGLVNVVTYIGDVSLENITFRAEA